MWAAASSALCQAQLGWKPKWLSFALQPLAQSGSHLPYRKPSFRNCSFRMSLYWSKPPSMRVTVAFSHTHSSWHTRRMKRSSWDTRTIPPCQYTRGKIGNLVKHNPGPRIGGMEILCLCLICAQHFRFPSTPWKTEHCFTGRELIPVFPPFGADHLWRSHV